MKYFIPLLLMLWVTGCANSQVSPSSEFPTADEKNSTSTNFSQLESISPKADLEDEFVNTEKRSNISSEESASELLPQATKLIAEEMNVQINLASQPSTQASSKGYGLVGDSVMVLDTVIADDSDTWHKVKFDSSDAEGWIEDKFIKFWNIDESLIQASQLSESQVKELMQLDGARIEGADVGNGIFKVILPSYIPSGFKLRSFSFNNDPSYKTESGAYTTLAGYFLTYFDSNNYCFTVGASVPPLGAPLEVENIEVYAPAIGNLLLTYTEFDDYTGQAIVYLDNITGQPDGYVYDFFSPSNATSDDSNCKTIDLRESIKITESLTFINP